jgi:hypothetical protein
LNGAGDEPPLDPQELLHRRVWSTQLAPDRSHATELALRPRQQDNNNLSLGRASAVTIDEVLSGHERMGVIAFTVEQAQSVGATLSLPGDDVRGHVFMNLQGSSPRKRLAKLAVVLRQPQD